ncbi:MAG: cytochrome b/b6 domain-containing protein [Granulosicoccus sp.]|nr:cytochrome b/b6 domain-containing protein [Granulosicoccus sp.]
MNSTTEPTIFYTPLQRRLHWLVLLLLILQYALQVPMKNALAAIGRQETLDLGQFLVTSLHTWAGMTIAALMIWRWQLRRRPVPLTGGHLSPSLVRWVELHHVSLYVATLLMAATGMLHYFGGVEQAGNWHAWGKWVLGVLIATHVLGALSHGGRGLKVLNRMMGRGSLR